jgi:hypothetical protein
MQFSKLRRFFLFLLAVVPLYGCHGTLEIWQLGESIGDDDDGPPELDYSAFEGREFTNIDWDQEARPQGVYDCQADWFALGSGTTAEDQALCPQCAHIWTVELSYIGTLEDCLQGTALPAPEDLSVRLGFQFLAELPSLFTVWRSMDGSEMEEVGLGAIDEARAEFTWSGQQSYRNDGEIIGYEWFLSGEGSF